MDKDLEKLISVVKDGETQKLLFRAEEMQIISFVLNYARNKHSDQHRLNGKQYINHPIAVAKTLVEYGADYITVCAGLLHDVVEEQVDAFHAATLDATDEHLAELEAKLFVTLHDDILTSFANTLVKPLLPKERECLGVDVVRDSTTLFSELRREYKHRIMDDLGEKLCDMLENPLELRRNNSEITQELEHLLERKKKQLEREVPRKAKLQLKEKYAFGQEGDEALDRVVHYTYDLCTIVDVVRILTREKGIFYYTSINNIFLEKDSEKKEHALLVKMADILDNTRDMQKAGVHSNSTRLYRCFKNLFVLNRIKNYFVLAGVQRDDPRYKLFAEACRITRIALTNVAKGAKMDCGKENPESVFNSRINEYFYCMHGHKSVLEKMHKDASKQVSDAIAFRNVLEKLVDDPGHVNSYLLNTFK